MQDKDILEVFSEVVDIAEAGIRYAGANRIMETLFAGDLCNLERPTYRDEDFGLMSPYLSVSMLNTINFEKSIDAWRGREQVLKDKLREKISVYLSDSDNVNLDKYSDVKRKMFRKMSRIVGLILRVIFFFGGSKFLMI